MSILKKVLALSLVLAMVFVMMAGAVTPFDDDKAIAKSASEAVSVMSALGVIKGFTDNTFRPEDTVTRAQMAKMIYVIMNFGSEKNAEYFANVVKPFSDTKSHWAEGFINFCYINGIISGRGDGTFDPDATVTGLEAAKMCLALIGYDAAKTGLVGSQWAINAASLGTQKGLFEDYSAPLELAAPREFAAQMLYNTLDAIMVKWDADNASYYDVSQLENALTVGAKFLSLDSVTGRLIQAEGLSYDGTTDDTDKILVDSYDYDHKVLGKQKVSFDEFAYTGGLENFGLTVKVLYNTKTDKAYGVFPTGDDKYVTAIKNDIDDVTGEDAVEINDTDYTFDEDTQLFINYDYKGTAYVPEDEENDVDEVLAKSAVLGASSDAVKLVVNKDKDVLYILNTERTFARISGATSSKIVFNPAAKDNGGATVTDKDDMTIYSGYKVDDYVFSYYDELADSLIVVKAPSVTSTVTSIKGTTDGMNKVKIASGTYAFASDTAGSLDDPNPEIGEEYTFYLDGALYIFADGDSNSVTDLDYAVVEASAYTVGSGGTLYSNKAEVKILKADGTEAVYTLVKNDAGKFIYYDPDQVDEHDAMVPVLVEDYDDVEGVPVFDLEDTVANLEDLEGQLVSYDFDDGKIELTLVENTTDADTIAATVLKDTAAYDKDDNIFDGKLVKDDAVFFIYTDEWNVYAAGDIKDNVNPTADGQKVVDGKYMIAAAFRSTEVPSYDSGTVYGFVVNDSEKIKDGDDYYNVYYLWTGSKIESFMAETDANDPVDICDGETMEGALALELGSDGYIDHVTPLTLGNITDIITIGSTTYLVIDTMSDDEVLYKVDSEDTKVIYVDSEEEEGSTIGSFYKTGSVHDGFDPNCAFIADGDNVLDAIVIDIGNDIGEYGAK